MRWRLWPGRRGLSDEERAAVEAARRSREAAQRDRAVAAGVVDDNKSVLAELYEIRVDNHLTEYVFDAAMKRRGA